MKLSDHQWLFLQDIAKLINYAKSLGIKLTGGELQRTPEQQKLYIESGKSKTSNSLHLKKLAIDINVFIKITPTNYVLTFEKKDIQPLGDFWEGLSEHNKWGGNWKFKDCPHFQRNLIQ